MKFATVYRRYKPQLNRVEQLMYQSIQSSDVRLTDAATQLLQAGGKRMRPLFALICGRMGDANRSSEVESVAAALEIIHMASLVHDDVIDNASLRRGRPTVRSRFGNQAAMYTGDYLFARAIHLLSRVNDPRIHHEMSAAIVRMTEGEIEQIRDFYNWKQSLRIYLRRVERKTALLISTSCSLSAIAANADDTVVSALRRFGYYTGMAFQIIDDVLDFTSSSDVVGKPVGGDLRQGNLTLPTLWATTNGATALRLQELVQPGMDNQAAEEAIYLVKSSGGLETSRELASRFLQKALAQLERIQPESLRSELVTAAQYVNQRLL